MDFNLSSNVPKRRKKISGKAILAIVLAASFFIALGVYFARSFIKVERENAVYTTMDEPALPVIYAVCDGMEINPMRGHFQDMGNTCADTVTLLPESRKLEVRIHTYSSTVSGLSYEIRNLTLDHFIEKTQVADLDISGDVITAVLPIQNLIEKDNMYLLSIRLDVGEKKANYYTRILWTDQDRYARIVQLAAEFSEKTFDPEAARDLTMYMETSDREKNDDLAEVTIASSFSQLTWGESRMKRLGTPEIYLRQCDGVMAAVEVGCMTGISDESGEEKFYTCDEFNMRDGGDRIYLMDYDRKTYEVFDGSKHRFSGKKIMLGITNEEALATDTSANGRYIAFRTDQELWLYDQEGKRAVDLFSFRSATDDGVRSGFRDHGMKVLSLSDTGVVDFVAYGYMNRGKHEGWNGITYYSYSLADDVLSEIFFVPIENSYEKIALELSELSASGNRMYFFKQNESVTGVDLSSCETMSIVSGLEPGAFVSNAAGTRAAWAEDGKWNSRSVKIMSIAEGTTVTYSGDGEDILVPLGYIENDLVLGHARENDLWVSGTREIGLPMYMFEIITPDGKTGMKYKKENCFVDNVVIENGRILFDIYEKTAEGGYRSTGTDTVVRKDGDSYKRAALAGSTTSGTKQKVWYLGITGEIKNTKNLTVKAPGSISDENAGQVELRFSAAPSSDRVVFYTYVRGKLTGRTTSFKKAVNETYERKGWVTDRNGVMIYSRTNKGSLHTVKEPFVKAQPLLSALDGFVRNKVSDEGAMIIDAGGLSLDQVLNFVYRDCPVAVTNDSGKYYLIYGYDKTSVKLYYPTEQEESVTDTIPREEAAGMIADRDYAYMCFAPLGR